MKDFCLHPGDSDFDEEPGRQGHLLAPEVLRVPLPTLDFQRPPGEAPPLCWQPTLGSRGPGCCESRTHGGRAWGSRLQGGEDALRELARSGEGALAPHLAGNLTSQGCGLQPHLISCWQGPAAKLQGPLHCSETSRAWVCVGGQAVGAPSPAHSSGPNKCQQRAPSPLLPPSTTSATKPSVPSAFRPTQMGAEG